MTDRERLLDLINQALLKKKASFTFEAFTDYLLANGVIVPPCKPGDKLFRVVNLYNGEILIAEGIALEYAETFENGKTNKRIYFWALGEEFTRRHYSIWLEFSAFGKTVFLTLEEAEKALKERADNVT